MPVDKFCLVPRKSKGLENENGTFGQGQGSSDVTSTGKGNVLAAKAIGVANRIVSVV